MLSAASYITVVNAVPLAVRVALDREFFPRSMKFVTTLVDIFLLTLVIGTGDGPRSPLVVGYFLILMVVALRFRRQT